MNSGQFQFSSGSHRSGAGCDLTLLGSAYRPSSVYGGALGTSVSISSTRPLWLASGVGVSWGSLGECSGDSVFLGGNEKQTMQNLNERLAAYLEKVRSLEAANAQLENCILEWHKKKSNETVQDFNQYKQNIVDTQGQIEEGKITNAKILLSIDNAKIASEDLNLKYQMEQSLRQGMQINVENLRKEVDNLTIVTTDLEMEIEGIQEEQILRKKDHEKDMAAHHSSKDVKVNVKVNAVQQDLAKILAGIRKDYEAIIEKNHQDLEAWYKEQTATVSPVANISPEEIKSNESEIKNLRRTFQALEIELQAQFSKRCALEGTLAETQGYYTLELQNIQQFISKCEEELSQLRQDIKCQNNQYKILLGIKTRLEKEISTYRQLLEGKVCGITENSESSIKEHARTTSRKIKTIMEDSVNGQVVNSTVNEIDQQI
uniref:Keratin 23 n=1 Tax=Pelodiscus sinensis TaxID=13735 RepID=K7F3Q7_PELSI|nr:keratin, type I cytoskeletal 23 [Pelodiscus sinensis]|eukprot:XP_006114352.1 keratin, type I cytoskeletal 23 [Pelodiscus sinensis]